MSPHKKDAYDAYFNQAIHFVNKYDWMANAYIAEFFTQNLWNQLPPLWLHPLEQATFEEMALILTKGTFKSTSSVWPLSLLSFVATCHALSLDRKKMNSTHCSCELLPSSNRSVKLKKRYELSILPQIIHNIAETSGADFIVDVGAGVGHLSRLLAFQHGLDITSIEMVDSRLIKASKLDKKFYETPKDLTSKVTNCGKITRVNKWINPDGFVEDFVTATGSSCVLVGLHTCGDLANTIIHAFKRDAQIRALVSLSCCYMRMSTCQKFDDDSLRLTFPLSATLRGLPCALKYKSLENACHFIEDYARKLHQNKASLKLHCYRAIVEVLVRHIGASLTGNPARYKKIRNANRLSFLEYLQKVFQNMGEDFRMEDLKAIRYENLLAEWRKVVVFYSLVTLLGPVVESIVLADKRVYLMELGFDVSLIPIFDPKISPRNFALIAKRSENNMN